MILTPDQRVRVFVSSTMTELAPERGAVRDAVLRLRLVPVMFDQGARPHPPSDVYRAYLRQSQIFVGVYGESYGWIAPGEQVSGLADELRLADELPRLIYVKEPVRDRDPRLAALLDGIHAASYHTFRTPGELRGQVEHDLAVLLSERFAGSAPPQPPAVEFGRLPSFRTPLIGRDVELANLTELVTEGAPLVTVVGPGGIGKTRLAVAAAERVADHFRDGVRFVDLSPVTSPRLVGEAVARGLGLRTSGAVPAATDVAAWLRTRRLLLVVDNFEHLADAAPVIGELLRTAHHVAALVTSRAPLRLAGERVYDVPPLSEEATDPAGSATVRLFVDTARAASPRFALTPENTAAVVELTRRLHGLPLAIILAAAKVRVLSPAAIVDHLGDQLGLLTGGARDLPDRQRTLRDTITWSYRLLRPAERALFDRLGVFASGWDLDALTAVAEPGGDPLTLLEALVESTLVRHDAMPDGEPRFSMLDTIRTYALERMRDGGQWEVAHEAHATHYLSMAQAAEPHLNRAGGPLWLRRLELDRQNVIAALDWLLDGEDTPRALRMIWSTWAFWWRRGHIEEATRQLDRILGQDHRLTEAQTGRALLAAGIMAFVSGQYDRAEDLFLRALPLLRAAGDGPGASFALGPLGQFAALRGEFEQARAFLDEAREKGENWQEGLYHSRVARLKIAEGDYDEALTHLRDAVEVARAVPDQFVELIAHYTWAVWSVDRGEQAEARRHLVDGLALGAAAGDEAAVAQFLVALADLDSHGEPELAVRLDAAAQALRTPSNEMWMRAFVAPWPATGLDRAATRSRLGPEAYDRAWQSGEELGIERAVAAATARR
ncbi:Predicted ATPase [Asanoa ishikariensis]|uniref:Predicted ATPase n=1 Tax=Asanoa ishikariensis TaxID=137265 RepID=A0A1H3NKL9_9ACTN|nr:Predicted ATPase [Asanoa ishikariensis]